MLATKYRSEEDKKIRESYFWIFLTPDSMLDKSSGVTNNSLLNREHSEDYVSDYQNIWEDFIENSEEESESVLLLCVFITFLSIIFLTAITTNVSILLVFARKQSLRTTSNRWEILLKNKKEEGMVLRREN